MSKPFKMKGWSGYQKPSAIRQEVKTDTEVDTKKNISERLGEIQKSISDTIKGLGVRSTVGPGKLQVTQEQYEETYGKKPPGLGLTNEEKIQAKKFGMSEYQWKTGVGMSGTQRHKKRMWENKREKEDRKESMKAHDEYWASDEGRARLEEGGDPSIDPKSYIDEIIHRDAPTTTDAPTTVDYGTGFDWEDWGQKSSTGWTLHKLVKERNTLNPNSPEYRVVQDIINETKRKTGGSNNVKFSNKFSKFNTIPGIVEDQVNLNVESSAPPITIVPKEKKKEKIVPSNVQRIWKNMSYEAYLKNKDYYDNYAKNN